MKDRIRCAALRERIVSADEAAMLIEDGMTVALSGFTPAGSPKAVPLALARQVRDGERSVRLNVIAGSSTGHEVDTAWGELGIIRRRTPYMTSAALRKAVNGGAGEPVAYFDRHLGLFPREFRKGLYGIPDILIVEAVAITEDGFLVPSTGVGSVQSFANLAKKIIVEVNLTQPELLEGMHDIFLPEDPPNSQPDPLTKVGDRIGQPYAVCPIEKIAAVVMSNVQEMPFPLNEPDEKSLRMAEGIIDLFHREKAAGRPSAEDVPIQSGVGSVSNGVLMGLLRSDFRHMTFYSEVIQDGILALIDAGKADFASGTSLSLSEKGLAHLTENLDFYRDKLILRNSEISNSPELIRRLGVISINTAIEADIYGNVNSTHMSGTNIYNGLGGSGDFARNAGLTVFVTASTAKNDTITGIVPMCTHVDHTEHDVDVLVTEWGVADLRGLSPRERAPLIIENCVHPLYRPQLRRYFEEACRVTGNAHTPHILEKAFSFHTRLRDTGTMLED